MNSISNDKSWKYSNFIENNYFNFDRDQIFSVLSKNEIDSAYKVISNWENYSSTPLENLNKLSSELGLKKIFYKDESKRFNLKSFKALGGAYAVEKISQNKKNITVSTATAGNHGRSVAWGAKRLGLNCKIFISEFVSESRAEAMRGFGAKVFRVKGNYDNSLKECIKQSKKNGWEIIQDVAWEGYELVPKLTMAGYAVMMKEISDQINKNEISHIFLQAGVGGMAAAMVAGCARYLEYVPKIIIVEPESADCVLKAVEKNKIVTLDIKKESLMGGMSCGEVSTIPWKIINNNCNFCISIPDDKISDTIKLLANSSFSEKKLIGGECATPGIISLIASCNNIRLKEKLNLDKNSQVLLLGCEGDVDEELYQKLLNK
jgi:diaminopropionate ammonia-lyase|tara:strand:- start:13651 stop:14778 length:1128 start_codon:yes stop_codon:yes gene_type:complete